MIWRCKAEHCNALYLFQVGFGRGQWADTKTPPWDDRNKVFASLLAQPDWEARRHRGKAWCRLQDGHPRHDFRRQWCFKTVLKLCLGAKQPLGRNVDEADVHGVSLIRYAKGNTFKPI
jgi:hypothetical protein